MTSVTTLKQTSIVAFIVAFAGLMIAASVGAATTGTVAATVTPELVSVSVSDGTVDYGFLGANDVVNTVTLVQTQTALNNGNVSADLSIRSSDALGGATWNLAASAGTDEYTHEFSTDGSSYTAFNVDNAVYTALAAPVAVSASQTFDLEIGAPSSATDSVEKTITVTVLATAS